MASEARKTDRRTVYTRNVIKDAFLKLKNSRPFNEITVADICRGAEISRGTFYLHYRNTMDVLDDILNDAVLEVSQLLEHLSLLQDKDPRKDRCTMCRFIRENKIYSGIFLDEQLTSHIIDRLAISYKLSYQSAFFEHTDLTPPQIEALFYFQMNGCFAVARRNTNCTDEKWCETQEVIDGFIRAGLQHFFK